MAHPLSDAMVGMTPEERAAYKAGQYGAMATPTLNIMVGRMVSIVEGPTLVDGMVKVVLALWIDSGVGWELIDISAANPFYFRNPPILVDDPAGDITRTWVDREGVTHTRVLAEDRLRALKGIVIDALKAYVG